MSDQSARPDQAVDAEAVAEYVQLILSGSQRDADVFHALGGVAPGDVAGLLGWSPRVIRGQDEVDLVRHLMGHSPQEPDNLLILSPGPIQTNADRMRELVLAEILGSLTARAALSVPASADAAHEDSEEAPVASASKRVPLTDRERAQQERIRQRAAQTLVKINKKQGKNSSPSLIERAK